MKKTIFILMMLFTATLFAQEKFTEFKAGLLMPSDAKAGFYGGLTMGRAIDENVSVSLAIDVYRRTYTKETTIDTSTLGQATEKEIQTELEHSTTMLPIFFQLHYQGEISPVFNLRITAGLGYEFLWNGVTNYITGKDETRFYGGFGWHVDAGVWYPISRASDFYAEMVYHSGSPSRDEGKTEAGLPKRTEVDMSGIGFRIGLRIYSFGF